MVPHEEDAQNALVVVHDRDDGRCENGDHKNLMNALGGVVGIVIVNENVCVNIVDRDRHHISMSAMICNDHLVVGNVIVIEIVNNFAVFDIRDRVIDHVLLIDLVEANRVEQATENEAFSAKMERLINQSISRSMDAWMG